MKPMFETRKPFSGLTRSLVIAIDIGTTFSGVSYAILEPGDVPKIHGVTRFPGQEHVAGNTKIPSILYYDRKGEMKAAGAETDANNIQAMAEDENWIKVELFKLRLRPRTMNLAMNGLRLAPLPPRKSPVHVFGDFLSYLYTCTTNFIKDTHSNGAGLLASVIPDHIEFVLAHPNGWEGAQQAKMRRAAVHGRLVPDTPEGRARIRFVTEGEASLHACVLSGLAVDVLSNSSKHGFLIADAGGGTLDVSSYAIKGTNPLVMEEIAPPDCVFAGSVFVSRRAREFFELKLKGSLYGSPDSLDHITRQFDEKTKRLFRDTKDAQFVPFGSPFDKDPAYGIRNGQLRLTGSEVANLFEPSIDATFNAIKRQIEASSVTIKSVFLVGGYAASPWLFSQLKLRLKALDVVVSRPDTQTSKAVADGAIGFYCDHHVSARMSKFMYGVEYLRQLDPNDPDHISRREKLCELPSGPKLLPDAFDCILARNVKVKESTVFTRKYCTELTNLSMLKVFEVEIWCYRGGKDIPKWIERSSDTFSTLCVVKADLSMLSDSAASKLGTNGKTSYWTIVFSVEIHFGLTEFQARIKWVQNGQTKYGPATIVFNERGHRTDEDEPDYLPEDETLTRTNSSRTSDRDRISRSRTPVDGHFVDTSRRISRVGDPYGSGMGSGIPEVARAPSTRPPASNPPTPSRAPHALLDKEDHDRRRSISGHSNRTRSARNSIVTTAPSMPGSPTTGPAPSIHSSRSRHAPASPALEYTEPPQLPPSPSRAPSTVHSPAKAETASLWDIATPTAASIPSAVSRAPSAFSTHINPAISIFGEDPKSAFATPGGGVVDLLGGGGDRPTSLFGADLDVGPAGSLFGEPANALGLPQDTNKGLWDDPVTEGGIPGGWSSPVPGVPRSVANRKSSLKGSPAVSRAPSGQGTAKPLSPLNPASVQAAAVEETSRGLGALPKIDTDLHLVAPAIVETPVVDTVLTTPITPSEPGTPTSATTVGKKKKGKKNTTAALAVAAAAAKREEEEKEKQGKEEARKKEEEEKRKAQEVEAALKEEEEKRQKEAEEEERRKAEEAEVIAKQEEDRRLKEAEAKAAEAQRLQEGEEKKRLEEEQRSKQEEETKRLREEEEAKALKKASKVNKKKEELERKKKEEQERKERERLEKDEKDRIAREAQEKERLEQEEKNKKEKEEKERLKQEEEQRKAEELRLEQERLAEEKQIEELRLEKERLADEESKRMEEEDRQRKEEEARRKREEDELRLQEERIAKELAELAEAQRREKEQQEQEEKEQQQREANARQQKVEKERQQKEEKERQEEKARQEQKSSLSFGGLWGKKTTSFASTLFGAGPTEQQSNGQDNAEIAGGWGFGSEIKKKPSITSLARSTTGLSKKPSRVFDQWGSKNGSTNDFGAPMTNPNPSSIFGNAKTNDEPFGLQDVSLSNLDKALGPNTTTAAPAATTSVFGTSDLFDSNSFDLQDLKFNESKDPLPIPPPPPPREEGEGADDAWGFADTKTVEKEKKGGKSSQQPTRASSPAPELSAKSPVGEIPEATDTLDEPWGAITGKGKKNKKRGKIDDLIGSEAPTRTSSPAPAGDDGAAPTANAEDDYGLPVRLKKKKKGKNPETEEQPDAETPVGSNDLNDELKDLLGGDGEGKEEATAEAADDWEAPVKGKKGKKGKKAGNDEPPAAAGETEEGPSAPKKKKKGKK